MGRLLDRIDEWAQKNGFDAAAGPILTALIERPKRLVYLSSGMHHHANANLDDIL
jgi:hypothetical protein